MQPGFAVIWGIQGDEEPSDIKVELQRNLIYNKTRFPRRVVQLLFCGVDSSANSLDTSAVLPAFHPPEAGDHLRVSRYPMSS